MSLSDVLSLIFCVSHFCQVDYYSCEKNKEKYSIINNV